MNFNMIPTKDPVSVGKSPHFLFVWKCSFNFHSKKFQLTYNNDYESNFYLTSNIKNINIISLLPWKNLRNTLAPPQNNYSMKNSLTFSPTSSNNTSSSINMFKLEYKNGLTCFFSVTKPLSGKKAGINTLGYWQRWWRLAGLGWFFQRCHQKNRFTTCLTLSIGEF